MPIIAGAAAIAQSPKVQQIVAGVVDKITGGYHQDNLFLATRNKTFDALRANGFPESEWSAYTKDVSGREVPDRLFGGTLESTYGPFYQRLFLDVQNYLNSKRPGMGDFFIVENQRIAMELPASERFKGSPWNAVESAANKFKNMNLSEFYNATDGLGIAQAFVQDGQIKIPNAAQAGDGIFSQLQNLGAAVLSQKTANTGIAGGGQVMSQPAAGISGQQQLASSGQVVLTGGVSVGASVTKNTTSQGSSTSGGSVAVIVVIAVLLFFGKPLLRIFGIKF